MMEVHGVRSDRDNDTIIILDGATDVWLQAVGGLKRALTPNEARFLGRQLIESANRVDPGTAERGNNLDEVV